MIYEPTDSTPLTTPAVVFVDRGGNEWRVTGHAADGDVLLACDEPCDPEDQGDGPSFPWTLRSVQSWFGPLSVVEPGSAVAS